ncbi:MAG: hypothetical protein ACOC44_12785 [Promethearchaeia archaeon]
MSANQLKEKVDLIHSYLDDFNGYIELEDLRSFLLFTLTSNPSNVLAQIGLGGNKEEINLPYDPNAGIYYQKVSLMTRGSVIVYTKAEPLTEAFMLDKDNGIFDKFLNPNEQNLAFQGKEKFIFPVSSDCEAFEGNDDYQIKLRIDDLFHSLKSFLAVSEPNILFIKEGKSSEDPDLVVALNLMPQMPVQSKDNILKIDVFIDEERKTRDITYLKRDEDFNLSYLKGIKEMSHSELYKSSFALILRIKSFKNP